MSKRIITILLAILFLAPAITLTTQLARASDGVGIHDDFPHARVAVTWVVDGDTIHISPPILIQGEYRTVVRLADINAPELDPPGGAEARDALINLLAQYGGVVYLDIDKTYGVDDYGRVIAVVYARIDDTTLLNVNKWMVYNGYAVIDDQENDFDPSKWSLQITYEKEKEKLPTINRVVLFADGDIQYGTSWGIKIATTPDRSYLGVVFSDSNYHLWVMILNRDGEIVRQVNLSRYSEENNLPVAISNVFRGMLTIAGNNTGFLVAWTQYSATVGGSSRSRIVFYTFIPIDASVPIPYNTTGGQWFWLYSGTYQYHPHATWYCPSESSCYWVIGYQFLSTTTSGRVRLYYVSKDLTTKYGGFSIVLTSKTASTLPTGLAVGIDVLSGIMYDHKY